MTEKKTRAELLANLADMVRELTEPRTHTEMRQEVLQQTGKKRRWVREKHTETHPSLMQELLNCLAPGASGDSMGTAGYESRPAADLEPLRVWTMIRTESTEWCESLGIEAKTATGTLAALVSAHHTDSELRLIVDAAAGWVRQAKQATGWEPAPFTLNDRCPECWRKNTLKVSGDLTYVRCEKCNRDWPEELIGILGQMLEQNRTHETVGGPRCDDVTDLDTCYLVAEHTGEHRGSTGRYWPRKMTA